MSNGKKWRDAHKVHRHHKRGWAYKVLGSSHHGQKKWPFRAMLKNGKVFDEDITHIAMRRPMAHEIWYWD